MIDYSGHYQLMKRLQLEPNILPAPTLYPFDDEAIFAAMLDRLAAPLEGGIESPFSSRNPLSAHGQLMSVITYLQSLLAHQINLMPELVWIQLYRMLGVELAVADRPVINIIFNRSQEAIAFELPARIPLGTEIRSTINPDLIATTLFDLEISIDQPYASTAARLNYSGKISPETRVGEFSILPETLAFIDSAYNDGGVFFAGRDAETLPDAMLRARQEFQLGMRCVTARDFYRTALVLGAKKVNVLPGVKKNAIGRFADLITIVTYPANLTQMVREAIKERMLFGTRLDVIEAEIIPIAGEVDCRIATNLVPNNAWNVAATAIQNNVNPPYGMWGDDRFDSTLATALENQPASIYAVPRINLVHAETGKPLSELDIRPWNLLEVQQSLIINFLY